jgi:hypothetical protein
MRSAWRDLAARIAVTLASVLSFNKSKQVNGEVKRFCYSRW